MPRIGGGGRLLAPSPTYLAIILLLLLSLLLPSAHGQAICSILDQRMAIVDDRLFFCSGNYTFDDEEILRHSTLKMYWLRLNDTIDVSGPLDPALLGSSTVPSASLSGGRFPDEGGAAGAFFYDHTTLYAYGALAGPEAGATTDKLWAFDTAADNWTLAEVWGGGMHHGDNVEGVHASDPASGASFYTGGSGIAYNGAANGTLVFSTKNSGAQPPEWDFKPASAAGVQGPNILKGAMVHVRRGRAGVLLAFGGYQTAYQGTRPEIFYWDQRPFSEIFVYDISSNTWYQQTATGDLPDPRTEFCAAVSSAPDDSSFQITMHGGWDQFGERAFNDVYVLSVPSFRWIRVQDAGNPDLVGDSPPGRNRHKCAMWNEASMLVVGGEITAGGPGNTSLLEATCNPDYPPIKVLDTSSYTWRTRFDPSLAYTVPKVVTDVIGGDSSGGAQMTEPEQWGAVELANIFNIPVSRDTYVPPGRAVPEASPTATDPSEPATPSGTGDEAKSSQGGASSLATSIIAGIAVGAVAFVAFAVSVVFFCRRRRTGRRGGRRESSQHADDTSRDSDAPSATNIPLVKAWVKPELEATATQRYELAAETNVYEVHGDDARRQRQIVDERRPDGSPTCSITL